MKSKVYFIQTETGEDISSIALKTKALFEGAQFSNTVEKDDMVAIKLTFGERGNIGYLKPPIVKSIVDKIKERKGKPFLVETNTLYVGERSNAVDHIMLAHEHGFSIENVGAPVIIGDGLLGEHDYIVEINQKLCKNAYIAGVAKAANAFVFLSHVTGHLATGMGATLKNIGMGLSARGGKLAQHSGVIPQIVEDYCTKCEVCIHWCPVDAITLNEKTAVIDPKKCIGCGECLAVCQLNAVKISWDESTVNLQKKIAEHCLAILKDKTHKASFFNFLIHVTRHCDCMNKPYKPDIKDIGILASTDPVAVEKAAVDMIIEYTGKDFFKKSWPSIDYTTQLTYAEEIGLGSMDYDL
ncbi:MAG: DUF362 domain-containing protein, partial [Candidatus Brocadiales bacterium]